MLNRHFIRTALLLIAIMMLAGCIDGGALSGAAGGNGKNPQQVIAGMTQADAEAQAQAGATARGLVDANATAYQNGYVAAYTNAAANPQTFASLKTVEDIETAAGEAAGAAALGEAESLAYQQGYGDLLTYAVNGGGEAQQPGNGNGNGNGNADGGTLPIGNENSSKKIQGRYIIVFREGAPKGIIKALIDDSKGQGEVHYEYTAVFQGFAATLPDSAVNGLRNNPHILSIELDETIQLTATQTGATWGLDRIDQRDLPLNTTFTYANTGAGVHAYIIDTGMLLNHAEFTGRVGNGYDAVTAGGNANDCNGHGTHVAGTVGGTTYGVAKGVTLHPVRVLDCNGSGTNSGVIAGVDWVRNNRILPAVANMSLGGGASSALDTAVTNAINAGITFAVAAGNENQNACNVSPARTAAAITVGATTNTDARASFSNYGTCLDIFAPGASITSAWITNTSATNTISGTSMASPHVAGVAALYLAANPTANAATVRNALVNGGTTGKVTSAGTGSPNVLLYAVTTGAPAATTVPTAAPTAGSGTNAILNPGFESGTTSWTVYSSAGYTIVDASKPRTGTKSAWFCGFNNCNEYLEQTITVPTNGTLTYYWHLVSSETTTTAYDYMYVRVYSTSGTLLATLRSRSNTAARNVWTLDTISLAAYAGQTVKLRFSATTDSSILSSFYIDDITVK